MPSGAAIGQVAPQGVKKKTFRPDIQGLRTIAVVAVILDHMLFWPKGGFVGVDVFFVISGFLITSLLLREIDKTGTISFVDFYRRRAKRILPAATLVIVASIIAAFALFNTYRAEQTFWDGVWATFFSANWHFASVGTDYFQADGPVSPLQHYWSLSVEEQFYFVWPWVMLLIVVLLARRNKAWAHRTILLTIIVITIGSFAWSMFETANSPTWAYFSTFSRAWELGIGAVVAVSASAFSGLPATMRPILGWIGLLGILASMFLISNQDPFPAPWALLPVAATALVIIAGTGGEQRFLWPITNPVTTYLGDISYSLYLWHFPLIIFLAPFFPEGSVTFYVICSAAILGVSAISYHFFENRIRTSAWLEPRGYEHPEARRRRRRRRHRNQRISSFWRRRGRLVQYSALAVLILGVVPPIAWNLIAPPAAVSSNWEPPTPRPSSSATADEEMTTATAVHIADVRAAITASSWPAFDPPIENLADQRVPQWTENDCIDVTEGNKDLCVYGAVDSDKVAVVMGDSIATSWLPAVIGALEPLGYRVQSLTKSRCPIAYTEVFPNTSDTNVFSECTEHQRWAADQVAQINPSLIVMSDSFHSLMRLASGAEGAAAQAEWESAYAEAIAALPAETPKVHLMAPPGSRNLQECYTPISKPSDCQRGLTTEWKLLDAAESAAAQAAGVAFVRTEPWFCSSGKCTSFAGTVAAYADSGHLTGAYSARLAPVVGEALTTAGVLR